MDKNLVDWYSRYLISRKDKTQSISRTVVADAFFSKETFITPMCENDFHVISRFRNDVILYYPTLEKITGKRGHPKWFDGRIDFAKLDLTRCKEYEVNKGKLYVFDIFTNDPETFLLNRLQGNELNCYAMILNNERLYVEECLLHGRKNLADTMTLIYTKQYDAYHLLKKDFFYFVRPFLIKNIDDLSGRKDFLKMFLDIRSQMSEPILVQGGKMIDADNDPYKNHLAFHITAYEIFDSLYVYKIAQRLPKRKMKYQYPLESQDTDKLDSLPDVPPLRETWHVALI